MDDYALTKAAARSDVPAMRALLEKGADINERGVNWQETPLIEAVTSGTRDAVRFLIDEGADLALKNCNGASALMLAVSNGRCDMVGMLLAANAPFDRNGYGEDVFTVARKVRDGEIFVANGQTEHAAEIMEMLEVEAERRAEIACFKAAHETAAGRQRALRRKAVKLRPGAPHV